MFVADGSRSHPSANNLDDASAGQAKAVGFASILTMDQDVASKKKKPYAKGKGKKRLQVATVGGPVYTPVKVPLSRDAHLQPMADGLEAANAVLPSSLCTNLMLPLAGMLAIFKATLESPFVAPKDKAQVTKVGDYLAKRLATIAALVDKSMPIVVALFDAIPRGEGGR